MQKKKFKEEKPLVGIQNCNNYCWFLLFQSMNLGRAFVTSGGIGQKQVAITIEAPRTTVFKQTAQIYGK